VRLSVIGSLASYLGNAKGKISVLTIVTLLAFGGTVTLLAATRFGIGISPDSVLYLDAAHNLLNGHGLRVFSDVSAGTKPVTYFPPLYSSALALLGLTGAEQPSAARWLNALLFGANIFLVGFVIAAYSRTSFWPSVLGSFLTLSATDILASHSFALAEPLFVFFTMIGLLCLTIHLDRQQIRFLFAASVFIGLSAITRYVGVASILAGLVVLLVDKGRDLRRKLIHAVIFGSIACIPIGLWAIRNYVVAGSALDRPFVFHPITFQQIVSGFSAVSQWLLLGEVRHDVRVIGFLLELLLFASLVIYSLKHANLAQTDHDEGPLAKLPYIMIVFIVSNVALLIFSISFVDTSIRLDGRLFEPIHVAALVLVVCFASNLYRHSQPSPQMRLTFVLVGLIFAGSHSIKGARWFLNTRLDGLGYASSQWRESPTIALVKGLPRDITIYSNGYDAIYYLTGRHALSITAKTIRLTGKANPNDDLEIEKVKEDLHAHKGRLVYFEMFPERTFLASESELKTKLQLIAIDTAADGSIYEIRTAQSPR
jgi:dolichyl-phosphate-mannose-protein mannosyltransferase